MSVTIRHFLISAVTSAKNSQLGQSALAKKAYSGLYRFYKRYYEDPFYFLAKRRPQFFEDGHVLDIGANIGYTASVFLNALGPRQYVYAFEPDQESFCSLSDMQVQNPGRLKILQAAVGNQAHTVRLWINSEHPADHRIVTPGLEDYLRNQVQGEQMFRTVRMVRMDDFSKQEGIQNQIAFVKIDIQGYELQALLGMKGILQANPKVAVAVEYSPSLIRMAGDSPSELFTWMNDLGFQYGILKQNGNLDSSERAKARLQEFGEYDYADLLFQRTKG
jgi:FkbM family methyltransferase